MLQIILAILAFGVLVIVHEFGHFITAKRGGVQVNEFWIGMGPTLLKHEHKGTLYCLKLLPFGGACVMEGEDGESENEHAFGKAKLPRRMLIVCAGALMNFLVGFLIVLAVMQPNGSSFRQYSVPLCSCLRRVGPMPIQNSLTCTPPRFAVMKCPNSCTMTSTPKARIARMICSKA